MHGNHTEMTRLCSALTGAARRAFRPTPTRSSHFCRGGVQPLGWRRALSTAHDAGGSAGGSTGGSTGGGVSATVPLHWGEMDAFAHMNNVSYFRHFETARIVHFEAMVREGERRRRYQRTLSLSTQPYTVYSTGYHGTEPYMYRDDARQSQWRVVERQDARGSEDRGQKTGGEDPAILPSFLYTRLHAPTPNLVSLTTPTVPTVTLLYPPCFSTSLRHRRDLRRGRFPFRERRRTHPRRYILPLQKTRQVNKTEDERRRRRERGEMDVPGVAMHCMCVCVCACVCESV